MSDAIDSRIQNLISAVENYTLAGGADNSNWVAESVIDLERQLLPPDHVAVDNGTLNRLVDDWGRWLADEGRPLVSDSGDSADILYPTFGDYVIAALSDTPQER